MKVDETEKTMGCRGNTDSGSKKRESNIVEILVLVFSFIIRTYFIYF